MTNMKEPVFQQLVSQALQGRAPSDSSGHSWRSEGNQAPVVEMVDRLLLEALEQGATDIHIEPCVHTVRIRFRVDGELCEMHEPLPLEICAFFVTRLKVMSQLKISEHRLPQDGRFSFPYQGRMLDIRVSVMPVLHGEKVVLRILNACARLLAIEELGLSSENKQRFLDLCKVSSGMVLMTGPVNSGKTTSLYAILQKMNTAAQNIITLEDPVEYQLPGINQIPINPASGLTFVRGLRSILRQDPDLVMLGEIRDEETAKIAVRAALTGHLIFSTLHTARASQSVFRLREMGIPVYLLAAALRGVLAQRLVRRLCPLCREMYEPAVDSWEAEFLGERELSGHSLYRSRGCPACRQTGFKGRMALQEILFFTQEIRQALLQGVTFREIEALAIAEGMIPLQQDGLQKALAGETSLAEIRRVLYGEI